MYCSDAKMAKKFVPKFSKTGERLKGNIIRGLLNKKGIEIDMGPGGLELETFREEDLINAATNAITKSKKQALQYGKSMGDDELRELLAKWLEKDGIEAEAKNVVITTGSQETLYAVSSIFLDDEKTVGVGLPTYLGFIQAAKSVGANFLGLPIDMDGINVDRLEEILGTLEKEERPMPNFVYAIPNFQNPSGVELSLKRREKLVDLANKFDFMILEDDPYGKIRFEGEHLPLLKAFDKEDRVIYTRSFSKYVAGGIRLAFAVAPDPIVDKLVLQLQNMRLMPPPLNQRILFDFMNENSIDEHIEKIIPVYKERRDIMIKTLEDYMPKEEGVEWSHPHGGFFLWLKLPDYLNTKKLLKKAQEGDAGVNFDFVPGYAFDYKGEGRLDNCMRLSYSVEAPEKIQKGIKALSDLVNKEIDIHNGKLKKTKKKFGFGRVIVDADLCKDCGSGREYYCISACSQDSLSISEELYQSRHFVQQTDPESCNSCGQCYEACPTDAITVLKLPKEKRAK